ncbi:hypothetical protein A3770_06p41500 [Chloropicon primus]|uniref:Uncharacterized protein n=1 Tax=Chloropicon primus TaxID=1764295 RepID=A0A5B8MQQ1_9CHLO|nr:hypothetical protein A3770_06p41500 [Chloropicon primus]|mmetsp:Transcript_5531/g.16793  ORF Transcript_5531/g.16793 Transcript_5531/m.16793 type:complete len:128 (-) Transcript_5531:161-544(-)|eukprot:QDZ21632.1 hypothetical protein A3770_06p41500 [Chloropicon primus]
MLRGSVNSVKEEKRRRDERKELLSEVVTQLQETGRYNKLVERASNLLKDDDVVKKRLRDLWTSMRVVRDQELSEEHTEAANKVFSDRVWELMISDDLSETFQEEIQAILKGGEAGGSSPRASGRGER